jgi:hypothetical protein
MPEGCCGFERLLVFFTRTGLLMLATEAAGRQRDAAAREPASLRGPRRGD